MPVLFAVTLFTSATLLFMVQPMVGKMVLPQLGGSPAVWNACMVFFQALLLLGYLYAHHVSAKYTPRGQWLLHCVVLGLPLAAFTIAVLFGSRNSPIAIAESLAPSGNSSPILSVLLLLTVAIGVPFFVVSTSAPLLQKWFTCTGHPSARDPYFLYSASNLGSMISLLGYPLFIEPHLTIVGQAWVFAIGFAILAVMIAVCGFAAANPIAVPPSVAKQEKPQTKNNQSTGQGIDANKPVPAPAPVTSGESPPSLARKVKWVALAFVPSSLMLGVTFYMTTDIASIPLLWVLPLALYLITFIIAFAWLPGWFRIVVGNFAPVMILLLVFVILTGVTSGWIGLTLFLHLSTFFAAALMCHYELARDRPSPQFLTGFFLLMSVGGVLGGIFNSLLAPVIFPHAYEYRLVLILACLMVPKLLDSENSETQANRKEKVSGILRQTPERQQKLSLALDFVFPILMGVGFYYMRQLAGAEWFLKMCESIRKNTSISINMTQIMMIYAVPIMICFFFVDRPLRFALCVAAILGPTTYQEEGSDSIHSERSFFGILKISENTHLQRPMWRGEDGKVVGSAELTFHRLVHGTTLHGIQIYKMENNVFDMFQALTALNPWDNLAVVGANQSFNIREEPLTYYHRTGPVGSMFHELRIRKGGADAKADFAMVGLGTGSASCYALKGQNITFYEIDPTVKKLVDETQDYFTYTHDARQRGAHLEIHMGDARLQLKEDVDRKYALLLVDAFSSDSIPVHLLTKEAVELYLNRMTDDGILALHISNKFVRLEPVVSAIARDLGLTARVWSDDDAEKGEKPGKTASSWVALARKPEHLGHIYTELGDLPFALNPDAKGNDKLQYTVVHTTPGSAYRQSYMNSSLNSCLTDEYVDELDPRRDPRSKSSESEKTKSQKLNESEKFNEAWLEWIDGKLLQVTDPREKKRLELYKMLIKKYGVLIHLGEAMMKENGHGFRKLEYYDEVHAWTDDYADVMRVMIMSELQAIRKFFGLPTPFSSED